MEPIIPEGICYVLPQVNVAHPITDQRHDLAWYPEREMTLLEQVQYRPYVKSVVTESPWIIGCYDHNDVRIWKDGEWVRPNDQTYGASVNKIMMKIIGVRQTIASTPLDGGTEIKGLIKKLEKGYKGK